MLKMPDAVSHAWLQRSTIVLAAVLASAACAPETNTSPDSLPTSPDADRQLVRTAQLEANALSRRINDRQWERETPPRGGPTRQSVIWQFFADRTFRRQFISDYSATRTGAWHLSATSESGGILFLATSGNDSAVLEVLSLNLTGDGLLLGELAYRETSTVSMANAPSVPDRDRQAVDEQRDEAFALWIAMTANRWTRGSAASPGEPDAFSFAPDGTYSATFAATQCTFMGTWSMEFSQTNRGALRLSVPANQCDPRGPADAFIRELPLRWDGANLFLTDRPYIAEN